MTADHFIKFPDPAAMLEALTPLGMAYTDDEGTEHASQGSHQFALWEVGEITGIEGWHVNLRVVDPDFDVSTLVQYEVHPEHPVCVWA
jgi:hypothetical protein